MFIIDKYVLVYAYVPEHFLSRKDLSYLDKLIYIRIVGFCRNDKYNNTCFASNGYFANLFGVKPKAISVTIKKLKDLDLINVKYIRNENLVKQRSITLASNIWNGISNNEVVNKEEEITYMKEYNNKINNKEIFKKKSFNEEPLDLQVKDDLYLLDIIPSKEEKILDMLIKNKRRIRMFNK